MAKNCVPQWLENHVLLLPEELRADWLALCSRADSVATELAQQINDDATAEACFQGRIAGRAEGFVSGCENGHVDGDIAGHCAGWDSTSLSANRIADDCSSIEEFKEKFNEYV